MPDTLYGKILSKLVNIKENSTKITSKMSRPLNELIIILRVDADKVTEKEASLVLVGEDKVPGILAYTTTKNKFSNVFKNSAFTAIKILHDLLKFDNRLIFAEVFISLDVEDYQKLKLAEHILANNTSKTDALEISLIINVKLID